MNLDALHDRRQDQECGVYPLRHVGPDSETSEPDVWCGRWRKTKGEATIRFGDGTLQRAELHSFEAHEIGRVYFKRKRNLD